jgi:hypothetical protein
LGIVGGSWFFEIPLTTGFRLIANTRPSTAGRQVGQWYKKSLESRLFRLVESSVSPRFCHRSKNCTIVPEIGFIICASAFTAMLYGVPRGGKNENRKVGKSATNCYVDFRAAARTRNDLRQHGLHRLARASEKP